jgi:hypothetical protein
VLGSSLDSSTQQQQLVTAAAANTAAAAAVAAAVADDSSSSSSSNNSSSCTVQRCARGAFAQLPDKQQEQHCCGISSSDVSLQLDDTEATAAGAAADAQSAAPT